MRDRFVAIFLLGLTARGRGTLALANSLAVSWEASWPPLRPGPERNGNTHHVPGIAERERHRAQARPCSRTVPSHTRDRLHAPAGYDPYMFRHRA